MLETFLELPLMGKALMFSVLLVVIICIACALYAGVLFLATFGQQRENEEGSNGG
jgi:hypothetical protein